MLAILDCGRNFMACLSSCQKVCQLKVGSYSHGTKDMMFYTKLLRYDETNEHSILDFSIEILPLKEKDELLVWHTYNYSLTGFEMRLKRNAFKYIVNYYLPSGLFVIVSWVSLLNYIMVSITIS